MEEQNVNGQLNTESLGTPGDGTMSLKTPTTLKPPTTPKTEKKIGHRRIDDQGETTYKKTPSSALMACLRLGIGQSVGILSSKPERDVLMQDFTIVESVFFPGEGSNITPAHRYADFRFKTYAPTAFRYFRDLFGIQPDDYMLSLCNESLRELSNPGASGSVFFLTADDEFIIKTLQHKEADFLQKLLPGYYMNLNQNPRTLLPKFFGLYCFQSGGKNIRLVCMNNMLPTNIKIHQKYDLKGSTFKRRASKNERGKATPTLKDLDFVEDHPEGILLDSVTYNAVMKTIHRDCRVLESFKIMDFSMLVGIHNLDQAARDMNNANQPSGGSEAETSKGGYIKQAGPHLPQADSQDQEASTCSSPTDTKTRSNTCPPEVPSLVLDPDLAGAARPSFDRQRSISKQRVAAYNTPREAIQTEPLPSTAEGAAGGTTTKEQEAAEESGGIPAKNSKGENLLMFLGIIDVLQCYKLKKKLEHTLKSMVHDGDTVSVHRPGFYSQRFQDFMGKKLFRKIPVIKHSPSKKKGSAGAYANMPAGSRPRASTTAGATSTDLSQPDLLPSPAPPPYEDIKDGPTAAVTAATSVAAAAAYRDRPPLERTDATAGSVSKTLAYQDTVASGSATLPGEDNVDRGDSQGERSAPPREEGASGASLEVTSAAAPQQSAAPHMVKVEITEDGNISDNSEKGNGDNLVRGEEETEETLATTEL